MKDRWSLLASMFTSEIKTMNLPVLHPYNLVQDIKVSQSAFAARIEGVVKSINIEGLKAFAVEDVFFDPAKLDFRSTVRFPKISFTMGFDVSGKILGIYLPGHFSGSAKIYSG